MSLKSQRTAWQATEENDHNKLLKSIKVKLLFQVASKSTKVVSRYGHRIAGVQAWVLYGNFAKFNIDKTIKELPINREKKVQKTGASTFSSLFICELIHLDF